MRKDPPRKKAGTIFWRQAPYSTGFPCKVSLLGAHMYHCTGWHCCERLPLALVNFLLSTQYGCPFHDGWFRSAPSHTALSVQQCLPKRAWPLCPSLPIHPILPQAFCLFVCLICFVSPDEKSPQRATFCWCGRGETKNGRSTKRHQNRRVQKLFWAVEKSLDRCSTSDGKYFEGDKSLNVQK